MAETVAGRMARTMPELDDRERCALLCENEHREGYGWPGPVVREASALACVKTRAWDARSLAWAKRNFGPGSDAYWAALP